MLVQPDFILALDGDLQGVDIDLVMWRPIVLVCLAKVGLLEIVMEVVLLGRLEVR